MDERDQMTQEKQQEEVKTTPELSAETKAEESVMTMETNLPNLEEGGIIQAKVVLVQDDAAYVDVGWKSDLPVPLNELTAEKVTSAHEVVKEGDFIEVKVLRSRDEDKILLSKRQAEQSKVWQELEEIYKEKQQVTGDIKKAIKGGLEVDLKGLRAFLPASQADLGFVRDLNTLVGQESKFYIIEFSIPKKQLVVSRRAVLEEEKAAAEERIYSQIKEGDTRTGIVTRLASFGAFVDIGEGVEGLLHVSEISWDHVGHPSERLKEGDQIQVLIIKIDPEAKRISLSLKQLIPHPWETAAEKFKAGEIVEGEVVRITPFGAFVHLGEGIDGLIHISQLSEERVEKPEDVVAVGQKVKARILKVDTENRRIGLSLREPKPEKGPEKEKAEPKVETKDETPLLYQEDNKPLASNLGDLLAEKMSAANNHDEKEG